MAISLVQAKSGTSSSTVSLTVTLTSATTAGNCLIAAIFGGTTSISNVKLGGSAGNWTSIPNPYSNVSVGCVTIWYDYNCAGGQTSVVITQPSNVPIAALVYEVSGLTTTSPLDQSLTSPGGGAPASGTTWSSGTTGTTTQGNEFVAGIIGGYNDSGNSITYTGPSSPWTNETQVSINSGTALMTGYQITSSTGTFTYSGSASGTSLSGNLYYGATVATFFGVAGPSLVKPHPLDLSIAVSRAANW